MQISKEALSGLRLIQQICDEANRKMILIGATEEVNGQPLYYEEAGAFLVGTQVAHLAKPRTRSRVELFLGQLVDEFGRPISQILAQEKRLEEDTRRRDLFRLLQAFRAGFERRRRQIR